MNRARRKFRCHCEESSDEAISTLRLLRSARNNRLAFKCHWVIVRNEVISLQIKRKLFK